MNDAESFKNKPLLRRVLFAMEGIADSIKTSQSFKTQLFLGGAGLVLFAVLKASAFWWGAYILASSAVLSLELLNTALEHLLDALYPSIHPLIKRAKDCAAGAVLVASLSAILILLIFLIAQL